MKLFDRLQRFGVTASDNRLDYWNYQVQIGRYYHEYFVSPYSDGKKILDVGCGEGGVLSVFENQGYACTGLEYSAERAQFARNETRGKSPIIHGDIQQFSSSEKFDVILILDVIEHVPDKEAALNNMIRLLAPGGIIVVSFPPFRSPFGGHQQVMRSWLKFAVYVHLLARPMYRWLLTYVEKQHIAMHLSNYDTGVTMKRFEALVQQAQLQILRKEMYLVRPRQAFRFHLKIRKYRLRFLREFLCSGIVYILKPRET
ncbi:MAG: class I SAM-dependent methyltransferase [Candidatus Zhuqueibacterota bacterium]